MKEKLENREICDLCLIQLHGCELMYTPVKGRISKVCRDCLAALQTMNIHCDDWLNWNREGD